MKVSEVERLQEKARHDEAQVLYYAEQEGISKRNIEIARSMMVDVAANEQKRTSGVTAGSPFRVFAGTKTSLVK